MREFSGATSLAFVRTNKLTVEEITDIRRELRPLDAAFTMTKKTFIRIALKQALGIDIDPESLPGQVTIVISRADPIAPIGIANRFANDFVKEEKMIFLAGYFEGALLDRDQTLRIATLPSRETLLAKLMGSMKSPVGGLARFFDAAKKDMEEKGIDKLSGLAVANVTTESAAESDTHETEAQNSSPSEAETPAA